MVINVSLIVELLEELVLNVRLLYKSQWDVNIIITVSQVIGIIK